MKSPQKSFYSWGIPWFLLAILLLGSVFGIRLFFMEQNSPEKISRTFQKEIRATELDLKNQLVQLVANFDSANRNDPGGKFNYFHDKGDDGQFFFFIFSADTLIYWNSNKVIIPAGFSKGATRGSDVRKLKNGWYGFVSQRAGSYCFLGCYLIRSEFSFHNDYIKSSFSPRFSIPPTVFVSLPDNRKYPVYSAEGHPLCRLEFDGKIPANSTQTGIIFIMFLLGSLSLFYFLWFVFSRILWFRGRENLRVFVFGTTIILIRIIQNNSGFPFEIYKSDLFSPALYSSSVLLPSLGDYSFNGLILILLSFVFYQKCSLGPVLSVTKRIFRFGVGFVILFIMLLFFHSIRYLVANLVINSSVSYNLQNVSGLSLESNLGFFIIVVLLISWLLISNKAFDFIIDTFSSVKILVLSAIIVSAVFSAVCAIAGWQTNFIITVFFLIYLLSYLYMKEKSWALFSVQSMMFFLVFYALFTSIILNKANQTKESEKRNLLALKLMTRRNPVTEVLYEQVERKLITDTILNRWLNAVDSDPKASHDSLTAYLTRHYFKDYWKKYQLQVTYCEPGKELRIQPQGYLVTCDSYFQDIIRNYGDATICPNLYFLDYGLGKEYYLAVFSRKPFAPGSKPQSGIIIELNLKNAYPDPGYPGLLMDKTRLDLPNLSDYSYGLFQDGMLVRAVGAFGYKTELKKYLLFDPGKPGFTENNMVHYQYRINSNNRLIISKKEDDYLAFATPFSYLFILFSLILLLVAGIIHFPDKFNPVQVTLRNRLHLSLIGTLVIAMLAIGIVQVITIIHINEKKNVDNLRERAASVVVEVKHKFGSVENIRDVSKVDLEDFLVKLSNIFFTDINVYDEKGVLVSSSRPQIFEEGLLSERMNSEAFKNLVIGKSSLFIHNESIGNMQFNSAYLPFYSDRDRVLGFVNLPYFAKQDESKKEISSFLVTFLNVYILLILFSIFVTILISNYITAPLSMLAWKMSKLRLGMVNEKITWKPDDEVGKLVAEYNRMIHELEVSAEKLARSERESAWREMARQVAHEIKNPLTPMKLSVQYLEKAWNEKAPDWNNRLSRFTRTLVDQIDALSVIASDFSDFAKMPEIVLQKVDMEELVRFVLTFYQEASPVKFEYISDVQSPVVYADRSQIIRVFTNVINNAVQAIGETDTGIIRIQITKEQEWIVVTIADNGSGIPSDLRKNIFQPEFTTKTSGMGLGLAIVKALVEGMKGEISFTSEEKKGTAFIIKFQSYAEII